MAIADVRDFIPELWSEQLLKSYKDNIILGSLPARSRGAQLLRDFALGHPEYGPDMGDPPDGQDGKFTSFDGGKANAIYKRGGQQDVQNTTKIEVTAAGIINDDAAGKSYVVSAGDSIIFDAAVALVSN